MVTEHEATTFARVGVKVYEHLQAFVLLSLLYDSLARGPDGRVIGLGRVQVHSIEVAAHCIQAIVASRNTIGIQHHDDLENVVLP